jgi:hypothetical protein
LHRKGRRKEEFCLDAPVGRGTMQSALSKQWFGPKSDAAMVLIVG